MNSKIVRKTTPTSKSSKPAAPARKAPARKAVATPTAAKTTPAAAPRVVTAEPAALASKPKHKLVRDSFTIPKPEYAVLEALKVRAANLARPVKKSELLRAGISALNAMTDKAFLAAVNGVPSLKTGRPSGAKTSLTPAKSAK